MYGRWRPKVGCQELSSTAVSHYLSHGLSVKLRDGRHFQSTSPACVQNTPSWPFAKRTFVSSADSNIGSHAFAASIIITKQSSQPSKTPFSMGKERIVEGNLWQHHLPLFVS